MSASDFIALAGLVIAAVSTWIAVRAQRAAARKDNQAGAEERVRALAREVTQEILRPVEEKLDAVRETQGKLEVKVDLFWEALSQQLAHILHSPHPERAELDALLELLDADHPGRLSAAQRSRLKDILAQIVASKDATRATVTDNSGQAVTMPILPNERLGAGLLLATLDAEDQMRRHR